MRAELRSQHVERNVLVRPARNQNHRLLERVQPRNRPRRARRNRVVVILHPVQLTHQLNAMLHAAEAPRHRVHIRIRCKTFRRAGGSHVIFNVVYARDFNIVRRHDSSPIAVNDAVFQPDAVRRFSQPREFFHHTRHFLGKGIGNFLVHVHNQLAGLLDQLGVILIPAHGGLAAGHEHLHALDQHNDAALVGLGNDALHNGALFAGLGNARNVGHIG